MLGSVRSGNARDLSSVKGFHYQHIRTFSSKPRGGRKASKDRKTTPSKRIENSPETPFISSHFCLLPGEVEACLRLYDLNFRLNEEHAIVETCPFCPPTKGIADNLFKLYILLESGVYICHRCKRKGNWLDLRQKLGGYKGILHSPFTGKDIVSSASSSGTDGSAAEPNVPDIQQQDTFVHDLWNKHTAAGRYLKETRGLNADALKKYGVGAGHFPVMENGQWKRHLCITFPMYDGAGGLMRHKIRSIETKSGMRLEPKGGQWGLFGLNVVPDDAEELIITEGEFDALSVHQATGRPAVSLPNGASSLPISLLPYLERFSKIILWMDDDTAGQGGLKQFSRKLGLKRCKCIRLSGCKDANDALRDGLDIEEILQKSTSIPHDHLLTFEDIREDVFYELANINKASGIKSQSLPRLNNIISGHRRGELTVFSGHTGIGKTTLLSQMALDFCLQGVPTLWGSFEVSNVRLVARILKQFQGAHGNKSDLVSGFSEWAERFSELPMYYMAYHGSEDLGRVLETMEYANYVHDCSHVVLDNLQFMTGGPSYARDRFAALDEAVGKLREFATVHDCHVSLVIHPRKELDDQKIQTASVFGSAKATQEADNVIILQKGPRGNVLDIRKNRFDGTLGSVSLKFDRKQLLYSQMDSANMGWLHGEATARRIREETTMQSEGGKWGRALEAYRSRQASS